MKVGIGLPNAVAETTGEELVEFARRGEANGFSTLGTIDRIVYGNYEPLVALAAAAAVTERIGLMTSVMLGPLRLNAVQTAKQALSINQLSGGRLTLGIGLGGRGDDWEVSGIEDSGKGAKMDAFLERIRQTFDDVAIGPDGAGAPEVLIGGSVEASFQRAAKYGAGWIAGGAAPDQYAEMAAGVREAWAAAGRDDSPRLAGLAYFALGDSAEQDATDYLTDYYAFLGEEVARMIVAGAAKDADTVKGYLSAFEAAGCEELIMFPCSSDPAQADLLGAAVA